MFDESSVQLYHVATYKVYIYTLDQIIIILVHVLYIELPYAPTLY